MIDSNILEYKNLEPLNVSRETFPQFEAYCELLKKENSKINLISKSTEKEIRKARVSDIAEKFAWENMASSYDETLLKLYKQ